MLRFVTKATQGRRFGTVTPHVVGKHRHEQIISVETEIYSPFLNNDVHYRGYPLRELVKTNSFLHVFHLILKGTVPGQLLLNKFATSINDGIISAKKALENQKFFSWSDSHVADVLISTLAQDHCQLDDHTRVFGTCLGILAQWHSLDTNFEILENLVLELAAKLLFGTCLQDLDIGRRRLLDALLILYIDHGLTNSAYVSRIATSEGGSITSSLIAALATHKACIPMITADALSNFMAHFKKEETASGAKGGYDIPRDVTDFCTHTNDPRSTILNEFVKDHIGDDLFEQLHAIQRAMGNRYWFRFDAYVYHLLTSLDCAALRGNNATNTRTDDDGQAGNVESKLQSLILMARIAGWLSHINEQASIKRTIQHVSAYIGPAPGRATLS